jgi:DMSO/TMAO reductase YedYZ molybdopterin-dependent catalytic subunit
MALKFFTNRNELPTEMQERIPPGQHLAKKWPVLTYGPTPTIETENWQLRVFGEVEEPIVFSWEEMQALPQVDVEVDMHCVTHWSKLDMVWQGIHIRDILQRVQVKPSAQFVIVHAYGGYTTNLSLDALDDDDVLLAHSANGEPLTRDHGYPMRLVVPKFYAWKSAKWISGLEFANHDRPGFWERNGYHNHGDPWAEERYS